MAELPEPNASGSSGTQQAVAAHAPLPDVVQVLPQLAMTSAVVGIAAERSHTFGGPNAAALVSGYATMMHAELQATKDEVLDVRNELKEVNRIAAEKTTRVAVLESEIRTGSGTHKYQLFAVTIGGFLVTTGMDIYKTAKTSGVVVTAIGALLVVVAWVWSFGEKK